MLVPFLMAVSEQHFAPEGTLFGIPQAQPSFELALTVPRYVVTDHVCTVSIDQLTSQLMIPALFCSWTGDALDVKTPLLRSGNALSAQAVKLLQILGDNKVRKCTSP